MLYDYLPILVFAGLALGLAICILVLGNLFCPKKQSNAKNAPYECGFDHFEDARMPFDVRFFLVAILFIIFDLETAFFFPWAVALRHIGWFGFISMMIFLGILMLGFIYEWQKGALEW
jgi:NADH-quinone oxidoreductase subunit A